MESNKQSLILSVITVCRNEAARILKTAKSIQEQDRNLFEWIVVDGASTDGTLDELSKAGVVVDRLVSEPDRGLYDAMNKGIRLARGEFILFINAGDYLENKNVIRDFSDSAPKADLIIGDIKVVMQDGSVVWRKSMDIPINLDYLYWRTFPHQSTFVRRQLFEKFGLYDLRFKIAADWEFFVRVFSKPEVITMIWPFPVAVFSNDGISSKLSNRSILKSERNKLRRLHYPAWYRWRRNVNEFIGSFFHCIRMYKIKGAGQ